MMPTFAQLFHHPMVANSTARSPKAIVCTKTKAVSLNSINYPNLTLSDHTIALLEYSLCIMGVCFIKKFEWFTHKMN